MTQKQSLLFFLLASLLIMMMYVMGNNAKKNFFQEKANVELFSKDAKSLSKLKNKFSDKKSVEKTIKTLNRIVQATKDYKKSDVHVLLYENVSTNVLTNLLRKIQNSTLNIKRLEINRKSKLKATLRLEIKK